MKTLSHINVVYSENVATELFLCQKWCHARARKAIFCGCQMTRDNYTVSNSFKKEKSSPLMSAKRNWLPLHVWLVFALNFHLSSPEPFPAAQSHSPTPHDYLAKILQLKLKETISRSPFLSSPSLTLLSQQGTLSPLKIKLTIFSAILASSVTPLMTLVAVWLSSPPDLILQLTTRRCRTNLFRDNCDHLPLTSSCMPTTRLHS